MRRLVLVMLLLPVLALPGCSKKDKATGPQVPSWRTTIVDAAGVVGSFSSLALDPDGHACIAYCDMYGPLKYAEWNGGAWVIQIADTFASVQPNSGASSASLALDAAGSPRIAYHDGTNRNLKFAARNGTQWAREALDEPNNAGEFSSLALDADGHCHISYHYSDPGNNDLRYLTWTGTDYLVETVDFTTGNTVGLYTSIALDAQGDPHISYYSDGKLRYTVRTGGVWYGEEVPGASLSGFNTSLALDAGGDPRISYKDGNVLKYASKSGAVWTIETVDATSGTGDYSSLKLDAQGAPHIAYYYFNRGDLRYAVKTGGTWTVETVDNGGQINQTSEHDVGLYASLALDAQGNPRIAYRDNTTWDLKYAEWGLH